MDKSRPFNASSKPFDVNWLYTKLLAELQAAKNDVFEMGNETAIHLTIEEQRQRRQKLGLPAAAVALAGIAAFGSGILTGNQSSGTTTISGSCQDRGPQNAETIDRLQQHASALNDFVMEVAQEHTTRSFS